MLDILNILYVVVVVLLLFGAAIFVHEFGHFWVALKRGLVVEEFAIGFGPIIWSKEQDGILYTIRCIPAGGFVKLPQMLTSEAIEGKPEDPKNEQDEQGGGKEHNEELLGSNYSYVCPRCDSRDFYQATEVVSGGGNDSLNKGISIVSKEIAIVKCRDCNTVLSDKDRVEEPLVSPFSKILVAFAGPLMNVIFAILIAVFLWIIGLPQQVNDPVVGYVGKSSEEYTLGVRSGDVFQSINGENVESWQDIIYGVLDSTGPTVKTVLLQGDREVTVDLPANTWNGGIRRIRLDNQDRLEIQTVHEPSLLASAGFKAGDLILEVNGNRAYSQYHLIDLLMENAAEKKIIAVQRNGGKKQLSFSTPSQAGVTVAAVPRPEHGTWAKLLSKLGKDLKPLGVTPAMEAGVQENDLIQAINGIRITSTRHLVDIVHANGGKKMELELVRGDETKTVYATPKDNQLGIALLQDIGIIFKPEAIKYVEQRPGPTPWAQVVDVLDKVAITFKALGRGKEKSGVGAEDLSGPIGIFGMLSIQVNTDLRLALSFLVLLNINLAILNLLPVPVLDGGHILMSLVEWVRKKPVSVRIQEYATTAFAVLLLCFFLFITLEDVKRVPLLRDIFNRDTQIEQSSEPAQ